MTTQTTATTIEDHRASAKTVTGLIFTILPLLSFFGLSLLYLYFAVTTPVPSVQTVDPTGSFVVPDDSINQWITTILDRITSHRILSAVCILAWGSNIVLWVMSLDFGSPNTRGVLAALALCSTPFIMAVTTLIALNTTDQTAQKAAVFTTWAQERYGVQIVPPRSQAIPDIDTPIELKDGSRVMVQEIAAADGSTDARYIIVRADGQQELPRTESGEGR